MLQFGCLKKDSWLGLGFLTSSLAALLAARGCDNAPKIPPKTIRVYSQAPLLDQESSRELNTQLAAIKSIPRPISFSPDSNSVKTLTINSLDPKNISVEIDDFGNDLVIDKNSCGGLLISGFMKGPKPETITKTINRLWEGKAVKKINKPFALASNSNIKSLEINGSSSDQTLFLLDLPESVERVDIDLKDTGTDTVFINQAISKAKINLKTGSHRPAVIFFGNSNPNKNQSNIHIESDSAEVETYQVPSLSALTCPHIYRVNLLQSPKTLTAKTPLRIFEFRLSKYWAEDLPAYSKANFNLATLKTSSN